MADNWDQFKAVDDDWSKFPEVGAPKETPKEASGYFGGVSYLERLKKDLYNSPLYGIPRGIKDVIDTGAVLAAKGYDALTGSDEAARVQAMNEAGKAEFKANAGPTADVSRIGGNVLATLPLTAAAGAGLGAAGMTRLGQAVTSGGFNTGAPAATNLLGKAADLGIRSLGGGISGGLAAGSVNPEEAGTGALIGAALPPAVKAAGWAGGATANALRGGGVAPEVAALADRAKQLGINIPADRLVDSRPMNALASALNYVPFSGRAATEAAMEKQLNTAASRLIGENTPNMTKAVRDASVNLGAKFDAVLKGNAVNFDKQLLTDVADVLNKARAELGDDAFRAVSNQVDELVAKGASGAIDGQAAYNIKRTLDRISRRSSPEAFHAGELKNALMGALNRSLGHQEAAAFAQTRQQYGNMLALENIARNGAEGEISVARLANMRDINNKPLQELADIAAQFVKTREAPHGAMQRAVAGMTGAAVAAPFGLPALAVVPATMATARGANLALQSNALREFMLKSPNALSPALLPEITYQAAPLLATQR